MHLVIVTLMITLYSIHSTKSSLSIQQRIITSPEDHLIEYIYNNSINYNCNFNDFHYCSFEHSMDWSFQLSLTEFAVQMKLAAERAAKIVQNFHNKETTSHNNNNRSDNNHNSNIKSMSDTVNQVSKMITTLVLLILLSFSKLYVVL
ncbi:unnamed protein product [Trichobilharzia regenti]|nr:unnamed protein product [Trichobilharzia regenti]